MLRAVARKYAGLNLMVLKYSDADKTCQFLGSGFLCDNSGYVLTSAHILNPLDTLMVLPIKNANQYQERTVPIINPIRMKLLRFEPIQDLALLAPVESVTCNVPPDILGDEADCLVGSTVAYMGFPFADRGLHTLKISHSTICGKSRSDTGVDQIHFDAYVHEGNSGGPVINALSGRIIGIVSGRFNPTAASGVEMILGGQSIGTESTIAFATHISYAKNILKMEGING